MSKPASLRGGIRGGCKVMIQPSTAIIGRDHEKGIRKQHIPDRSLPGTRNNARGAMAMRHWPRRTDSTTTLQNPQQQRVAGHADQRRVSRSAPRKGRERRGEGAAPQGSERSP